MKKKNLILALTAFAVSVATCNLFAAGRIATYDFEDYGTSITVTNNGSDVAIDQIVMRYDSANQTNTLTISRVYNSVTYRIASEAGSNVQDDLWLPTNDLQWRRGEVIQLGTTVTNLNILIEFVSPAN